MSSNKIFVRDLSSINTTTITLDANTANIRDLSSNKIFVRDLSGVNLQISGTATINNLNISNIDASINITNNNDNKTSYLVFVDNSGNQKLQVDKNVLIFNPGLNRIGLGQTPNFNMDISGSFGLNIGTTSTYTFDVSGETRIQSTNIRYGRQAGDSNQGSFGIAIGFQAGQLSQSSGAIAIGYNAGIGGVIVTGQNGQGINAIAIGSSAGSTKQSINAIAIGSNAGQGTQASGAIAIGVNAGIGGGGIGTQISGQGINAISIGTNAGTSRQAENAIAIGVDAGKGTQSSGAIAIGYNAGSGGASGTQINGQGLNAIAIGINAGATKQGTSSISIGDNAGYNNQNENTIAIGNQTGYTNQGKNAISVGYQSGNARQESASIAIGYQAGYNDQSNNSIAIGDNAGALNQDFYTIAIGSSSGFSNQNKYSISIGTLTGYQKQGTSAIAIGYNVGKFNQGLSSIAIGNDAAITDQSSNSIAIGTNAGATIQSRDAIAIGRNAGLGLQGISSVAIGAYAGQLNQPNNSFILNVGGGNSSVNPFTVTGANTIVLNAESYNGSNLFTASSSNATYINPIRARTTAGSQLLYHDRTTKEVFVAGAGDRITVFSLNESNPDISMSTVSKFYPLLVDSSGQAIPYIDNNSLVFDVSLNRLGIGISDPSFNLDVSGSAKITNQLLVGNVTTSSLTFDVVGDTRIQSDNIRFGTTAGNTSQGSYAVAIGFNAGAYTQLVGAVSIGYSTGQTAQGANAVAIGYSAGQATQGGHSVAIGYLAGQTRQGDHAIAIGREAGAFEQGTYSIAIGYYAGRTSQFQNSIVLNATNIDLTSSTSGLFIAPVRATTPTMAISKALYYDTTTKEVLYGDISSGGGGTNYWTQTGNDIYNNNSGNVGIGTTSSIIYKLDVSGETRIQTNNVRIGRNAGNVNQGSNAIAIGVNAGRTNQTANSIIINATGVDVSSMDVSGLFVAPIRQVINNKALYYNTSTKEITYGDISSSGASSQWTTTGNDIYNNNTGNVGIGTSGSASYKLDVSGTANIRNNLLVSKDVNIANTTTITKTIDTSCSLNIITYNQDTSIIDIYFTSYPYGDVSNTIVDISFANWGSNNVITLVDITSASRSTGTSLGSGVICGKYYAMNTTAGSTFNDFTEVFLTQKDSTLTLSSPSNYGLRMSFKPTYQSDIVTGSIRVVNATGRTPISSIYVRLFNSSGISPGVAVEL